MRTITLTLAAALFFAAPVAAQNTALVAGGGGRAVVRVEAKLLVPAITLATETQTLAETWKGTGYTEYLATYTVRANTRWDLVTTAPEGVTLLAQNGEWTTGNTTIGNGGVTNGATILVRVRVADGTAGDWRDQLHLEAVRGF